MNKDGTKTIKVKPHIYAKIKRQAELTERTIPLMTHAMVLHWMECQEVAAPPIKRKA